MTYTSYIDLLEVALHKSVSYAFRRLGYTDKDITAWFVVDVLEPSKTYLIMDVLDIEQIGREIGSFRGYPNDPHWMGLHQVMMTYKARVQFSIIGARAREMAPRIKYALTTDRDVLGTMTRNGLGAMHRSTLRKNDQVREAAIIPAYNFDMTFSFSHGESHETGVVRTVGLEGGGRTSTTEDYYDIDPLKGTKGDF